MIRQANRGSVTRGRRSSTSLDERAANRPHRALFVAALVGVLSASAGCATSPGPIAANEDREGETRLEGAEAREAIGEEVLEEHETFLAAQNYPLDDSRPLVASTAEQRAFVAAERAELEGRGISWTPDEETIALSLAFEGCTIAILNSHAVDADLLRTHVTQSDTYAYLVPSDLPDGERIEAEASVTRTLVRGATFLCPEDGTSWTAASAEVYGG
jgi:hypothetical protein